MSICKSAEEIKVLRQAGKIAAIAHAAVKNNIQPGISTIELDQIAESVIRKNGAIPAFKGYNGFLGTICASINEELVHGIPSDRRLMNGDLITIDIGVNYNGYYSDTAWTYPVGTISEKASSLLYVTEQALYHGIKAASARAHLFDLSHAIQTTIETNGFSVIQDFGGHGIGRSLHEAPFIPNVGPKGKGPLLLEGMVLAIEPLATLGQRDVLFSQDGSTVVMKDGAICAHFEHTVVITKSGAEILSTI